MTSTNFNHAPKYAQRESGLLVPFRSLPGDHDHQGTLGDESVDFLRQMNRAGFSILHDLPSTPPDRFNCPYSPVSAFALDPQRIDLEKIVKSGDLTRRQLDAYQWIMSPGDAGPDIQAEKVDLLRQAFVGFDNYGQPERKAVFAAWQQAESEWLEPYAAFSILSSLPQNSNKQWQNWDTGKDCNPELITAVKAANRQEFAAISYQQWVVEQQTLDFLDTAKDLGIEVWGDVPFYVGSGEVWANREIFNLDPAGNQLNQGGAPPPANSTIGQPWGNATYNIDPKNNPEGTVKAADWWAKRILRAHKLHSGKVRLDHFMGFVEPYILPIDSINGQDGWHDPGVGDMLFSRLQGALGDDLPLYPEDLGKITHKTPELRDKYGFLRTALAVHALTKYLTAGNYEASANNPANYTQKVAAFSSNHDSPTLVQAFDSIRAKHPSSYDHYVEAMRNQFPEHNLSGEPDPTELAMLEMKRVMRSASQIAIIAIWDYLGLGASAQYNKPGIVHPANWSWRMSSNDVKQFGLNTAKWRELNKSSARLSPFPL